MDEKTLKKIVMNTPFSYPLVEGNPLNTKLTDPRLKVKCCYISVVTLDGGSTKEVFIKPDATFIVTKATYNYGTFDLKVNREIEGEAVAYEDLPLHIGAEHMNLIDERLHYYLYKSITKL